MIQKGMKRRALLLLDFQRDFLEDSGRMPVARGQIPTMIEATRATIFHAVSSDGLIIKIGNEFRRRDILGNLARHDAARAGTPGCQWDPRIDAGDVDYFAKWKRDAFCNPGVSRTLEAHGIEEIVLTGLYARACVTSTARSAIKRGFSVVVVADAIACSSDTSRRRALADLTRRGVTVIRDLEVLKG